jgi:adenylate cyclase
MFHVSGGVLPKAHDLVEQMEVLTRRTQEPASMLYTSIAKGLTQICRGELRSGRATVEEGLALTARESVRARAADYGQDAISANLIWLAIALSFLGYPDEAFATELKAIARARETSHPYTLGYALHLAAWVRQLAGDSEGTLAHCEAAIALSKQHGFSQLLAVSGIFQASVAIERGETDHGLPELRHNLAQYRGLGGGLLIPYFLALLATGYVRDGDRRQAMETLDEAIAWVEMYSERLHEPELYRLKSELQDAIRSDDAEEAEAGFQRAIEVARTQGAKLMELRASTSLARVWARQNRNQEARDMLAGIYGWFTEGLETRDLKEAKTLLDRLS